MSTFKSVIRSGTFLGGTIAALALSACSHSGQSARYANVYDFEGGGPCVENCVAANPCYDPCVATAPVYVEPAPVYTPQTENVIYADCSVINDMACPAPVYQPAQVYTTPTYDVTVNCPAGTTAAGDGTCLQDSYSPPAPVYQPAPVYTAPTCPAGTTLQSDGSCIMTGYSQPVDYTPTDYRPVRK
ncbi:hypothetical protein [Robiginitomaculum antarcticum]|uniref:hypothetical protein n=1 Tax=Robiginitomaculum antarcticum TaxID=437507 RepID=UPI0003754158|nr:hypothetical protein [Robiginitomaculum antarcticum]